MFSPIAYRIIHLETTDSTNNYAAILLSEGKADSGTVILAEEQTAGRGQRGAVWLTKPGENLTFSVILKPANLAASEQFKLSQVVALSLIDVLRKIGINAVIKWPNDVLVGTKKIAGILIENQLSSSSVRSSVIGIGLNVNQLFFEGLNATSIAEITGEKRIIMDVLLLYLDSLNRYWGLLGSGQFTQLEEEYLKNLYGTEQAVLLKDEDGEYEGKVIGTDPIGRLLVSKMGYTKCYDLKEVQFIFRSES